MTFLAAVFFFDIFLNFFVLKLFDFYDKIYGTKFLNLLSHWFKKVILHVKSVANTSVARILRWGRGVRMTSHFAIRCIQELIQKVLVGWCNFELGGKSTSVNAKMFRPGNGRKEAF